MMLSLLCCFFLLSNNTRSLRCSPQAKSRKSIHNE
jgi:hypothetical protein